MVESYFVSSTETMYLTRVTKLKKTAGQVVYNYDIYIGPEIKNSSWSLEESVWHNPYQFSGGSLKRRHELYKKRIFKPQRRESCDLEKIRGRMLACICPDVTSCHGHILARMVHDKHPEYKNLFRASPEDESLSIDGGDVVFRWFKFTLKPPNRIGHGKLRLAIWDTSFWTFWVKFGHNGP